MSNDLRERDVDDVLSDLEAVCDDIFERWDKDMRAGKLLSALQGRLPGYDPRVDRIRAVLSAPQTPEGGEG